jgi:hypothetical protein
MPLEHSGCGSLCLRRSAVEDQFIMLSALIREWQKWRGSQGTRGGHVTVIEWREDGLLALRVKPQANGGPQVHDAQFIECAADKRDVPIARLARQGWFKGSRNIMMLGIRQRQMAMLPRPNVPDAELVDAARWQLQGVLDYPPEEAVLDVLRLGMDEPPARQQLAVFAVRRSVLARWTAPLAARKVTLEAVEVADCAQRNLAALHPNKGQPVAMLSLREDSIVFSVTRGAEVLISRSFEASSVKAPDSEGFATDIAALADRVGLQLQRMLDTLERRSAAMAPSQILVLNHTHQTPLLMQCAELTGLRVMPLDLSELLEPLNHTLAGDTRGAAMNADFLHLLGAALRPAPVLAGASA